MNAQNYGFRNDRNFFSSKSGWGAFALAFILLLGSACQNEQALDKVAPTDPETQSALAEEEREILDYLRNQPAQSFSLQLVDSIIESKRSKERLGPTLRTNVGDVSLDHFNDFEASPTGSYLTLRYPKLGRDARVETAVRDFFQDMIEHPICKKLCTQDVKEELKSNKKADFLKRYTNLAKRLILNEGHNYEKSQVFYHGFSNDLRLVNEVLRQLKSYELLRPMDNTYPMRDLLPSDRIQNKNDFLRVWWNQFLTNRNELNVPAFPTTTYPGESAQSGLTAYPDSIPWARKYAISSNLILFGNWFGLMNNTLFFFANSSGATTGIADTLLKSILSPYAIGQSGSPNEQAIQNLIQQLKAIHQKYMGNAGGQLAQIFIENPQAKKVAYPAWNGGEPIWTNKTGTEVLTSGPHDRPINVFWPTTAQEENEMALPSILTFNEKWIKTPALFAKFFPVHSPRTLENTKDALGEKGTEISNRVKTIASIDRTQARIVATADVLADESVTGIKIFTSNPISAESTSAYEQEIKQAIRNFMTDFISNIKSIDNFRKGRYPLKTLYSKIKNVAQPDILVDVTDDDRFIDADLNQYFAKYLDTRRNLKGIREKLVQDYWQQKFSEKPNYVGLAAKISESLGGFISDYMNKALDQIPYLRAHEMSFAVAGSLARKDSGLFTDLEGFALIPKDTSLTRFLAKQFAQSIGDVLFALGEHPDLGVFGLRLDEADSSPMHYRFFARDMKNPQIYCNAYQSLGGKETVLLGKEPPEVLDNYFKRYYPFEGSWANIGTPAKITKYLLAFQNEFKPFTTKIPKAAAGAAQPRWVQWIQNEKLINYDEIDKNNIKQSLKEGDCSYGLNDFEVSKIADSIVDRMVETELSVISKGPFNLRWQIPLVGNPAIYADFIQRKAEVLDPFEVRSKIVEEITKFSFKDYRRDDYAQILFEGKVPYTVDIKRTFFRMLEQFATNLGFLYQTYKGGQVENIDVLVERQIVGPKLGARVKDEINFILGLRIRQEVLYGGQPRKTYVNEKAYENDLNGLRKELEQAKASFEASKKHDPNSFFTRAHFVNVVDLTRQIESMPKLNPNNPEPIIGKADLKHLQDITVPLMQELFQRVASFQGIKYKNTKDAQGKMISTIVSVNPNNKAFLDTYKPSPKVLQDLGIVPLK